jgi:hypothetical protein
MMLAGIYSVYGNVPLVEALSRSTAVLVVEALLRVEGALKEIALVDQRGL